MTITNLTLEARLGGDIIIRLRNILVAVNMLEPGQCTHTNNEIKKSSPFRSPPIHCRRNWLNTTSGADPAISKGGEGGSNIYLLFLKGVQFMTCFFERGVQFISGSATS